MHREGKEGQLLIKNGFFSDKKISLHCFLTISATVFSSHFISFFNLQFNPPTDGFHISILNYTDVVRVDGKGPLEVLSLHNCWLGPAALELLESLFL